MTHPLLDHPILKGLSTPKQLQTMTVGELEKLGDEIRDVLCNLLAIRTAHFASNLGVVELCLALHSCFDFSQDRLIWDTGHQIYPHKLITGRYKDFASIRTKGGLMGFPNPNESNYDLFMTGHAGCSVSTALGLASGDSLMGAKNRHSVAVIGDGAFPSGIVYEALNNAGGLKEKLLVILNDNKMSICPRTGGMADYLDRLRTNPFYTGLKTEVQRILNKVPLFGDPAERLLAQLKEGVKAGLHGGMFFEDLGMRYIGPIDGHNIGLLKKYLDMVKAQDGPVLLHIVTEKGHGFEPAAADPVFFHAPPAFVKEGEKAIPKKSGAAKTYTHAASEAIRGQLAKNPKVTVLTAAMCQGNKLETVREEFPKRFFDTGICESHAVAFAAGQAKAGMRPIVDIYSTFLQRSFDQIFQEVALQNLPVTFMLDRGGLAGPDGPTHHGAFDLSYMRIFPNMVVMAPGDDHDVETMLEFSLEHPAPCSVRYPRSNVFHLDTPRAPLELGKAEVLHWSNEGVILCGGALLPDCIEAAQRLKEEGIDVGIVNMRFVKPIDKEIVARAFRECGFVLTVEENCLPGGFGAAVLEAAEELGVLSSKVKRLGIPDRFIEHGERAELLADCGLDAKSIAATCREMLTRATESAPA